MLESTSPGIVDAAEREARCNSDAALAEAIERDGIVAFVDHWQALPLFSTQTQLPAAVRQALRRQRLSNNAPGLANSLRGLGAGMQESVLQRLGDMRIPTLVLAGALDAKYCAFADLMATTLPNGQVEIGSESGHAIHLEQPTFFAGTIRRFLQAVLTNATEEKGYMRCV